MFYDGSFLLLFSPAVFFAVFREVRRPIKYNGARNFGQIHGKSFAYRVYRGLIYAPDKTGVLLMPRVYLSDAWVILVSIRFRIQ